MRRAEMLIGIGLAPDGSPWTALVLETAQDGSQTVVGYDIDYGRNGLLKSRTCSSFTGYRKADKYEFDEFPATYWTRKGFNIESRKGEKISRFPLSCQNLLNLPENHDPWAEDGDEPDDE